MPSETRFIFFETSELLRASLDWAVANGKKLGKAKPSRLHVDLEALTVTVSTGGVELGALEVEPDYDVSQPNGDNCPPYCKNAAHTLAL